MLKKALINMTALGVAAIVLSGCSEFAGTTGGNSTGSANRNHERASRLSGSGIVVFSCGGKLTRVDPSTGKTVSSLTYRMVPNETGLRSAGADGCDRQRNDLREAFSSDYSKLGTAWRTRSGQAVGYINPGGQRKVVVEKKRDAGFSGGGVGSYKWPRFNPKTDEFWYAQSPADASNSSNESDTVYSRPLGGGREVRRGECNCAGYEVAWPSGWMIPYSVSSLTDSVDLPLVTPDGRTAYMPVQWGAKDGLRHGYAYRPWSKGTKFAEEAGNPNDPSMLKPNSSDIMTNQFCGAPDVMMIDDERAFCDGESLVQIDQKKRHVSVHKLIPATQRSITDPTISPDKQKYAFLASSDNDRQVRLYTEEITYHGEPPEPRLVATFPRRSPEIDSTRILSWD